MENKERVGGTVMATKMTRDEALDYVESHTDSDILDHDDLLAAYVALTGDTDPDDDSDCYLWSQAVTAACGDGVIIKR